MRDSNYTPCRSLLTILFPLLLLVALLQPFVAEARKVLYPRMSIFADHIRSIAQQENISFLEAAETVKKMGYEGVDVWVTSSEEELKALDEVGFEHASAIVIIDHARENYPEVEKQALDFMHKHDFQRVLLVPGLIDKGAPQGTLEKVLKRIDEFSRRAAKEGLDVTIEDYDNPLSPCYNTEALDLMFKSVPRLNHNFDTGNYLYCGEDPLAAAKHFRKRIHHVHLKDRKAPRDLTSPAVGTGVVPMREIVSYLLRKGYKGWFCVEFFGNSNMLECAQSSIRHIQIPY